MRDDLLHHLSDSHDLLLNDRYFDSFLDNLLNFLTQRNNFLNNFLHLLDSILEDNLLFQDLNLLYSWYFFNNLHNFLNHLRNFLDFLNSLDHGDYFFNYPFDNLRHLLNMVDSLLSLFVLDCVNYLFNNSFNLNDDWLLDNSLHNLLHYSLNLFDLFLNFLDNDSFLPDHFHLLNLWNWLIDYFLHRNWLLHFNDLFSDDLNFNNLGHLNSFLHYFFDILGHFN